MAGNRRSITRDFHESHIIVTKGFGATSKNNPVYAFWMRTVKT